MVYRDREQVGKGENAGLESFSQIKEIVGESERQRGEKVESGVIFHKDRIMDSGEREGELFVHFSFVIFSILRFCLIQIKPTKIEKFNKKLVNYFFLIKSRNF